jgi:hypothetical protein
MRQHCKGLDEKQSLVRFFARCGILGLPMFGVLSGSRKSLIQKRDDIFKFGILRRIQLRCNPKSVVLLELIADRKECQSFSPRFSPRFAFNELRELCPRAVDCWKIDSQFFIHTGYRECILSKFIDWPEFQFRSFYLDFTTLQIDEDLDSRCAILSWFDRSERMLFWKYLKCLILSDYALMKLAPLINQYL